MKQPYAPIPRKQFAAYGGIDLAQRYSGILLLDTDGRVAWEHCPQDEHPALWIETIKKLREQATSLGASQDGDGLILLIEDIFPSAALTGSYKPVVRLQGALTILLHLMLPRAVTCWKPPIQWQKAEGWPALKRTHPSYISTKRWAKEECERRSYVPPLWTRGSKALEDIRDAALIADHLFKQATASQRQTLPRRVEETPLPVLN
jgi:hypothetical protein